MRLFLCKIGFPINAQNVLLHWQTAKWMEMVKKRDSWKCLPATEGAGGSWGITASFQVDPG